MVLFALGHLSMLMISFVDVVKEGLFPANGVSSLVQLRLGKVHIPRFISFSEGEFLSLVGVDWK